MRAVVLVVAVTVSCARQAASVDQGTSAGPETSDAAIPEPDTGTAPTIDAGTADAGSEPAPTLSDAWNIQDVGAAEQCSLLSGCLIPTLATNEDGQLSFGAHTLRLGPCLMCFADRLVRGWNGNSWETVISDTGARRYREQRGQDLVVVGRRSGGWVASLRGSAPNHDVAMIETFRCSSVRARIDDRDTTTCRLELPGDRRSGLSGSDRDEIEMLAHDVISDRAGSAARTSAQGNIGAAGSRRA
jgi:hypothetical protein